MRNLLIVAQVAVSFLLLIGRGLMLPPLVKLRTWIRAFNRKMF